MWTRYAQSRTPVAPAATPVVAPLEVQLSDDEKMRAAKADAMLSRSHDDDPTTNRHVLAMQKRKVRVNDPEDDGRTRFVFVKMDTRKIDAGIGAVLAREAAATMPAADPSVPLVAVFFALVAISSRPLRAPWAVAVREVIDWDKVTILFV
mgnify:CR=1 FL=1